MALRIPIPSYLYPISVFSIHTLIYISQLKSCLLATGTLNVFEWNRDASIPV
jgi:hypothetical protein